MLMQQAQMWSCCCCCEHASSLRFEELVDLGTHPAGTGCIRRSWRRNGRCRSSCEASGKRHGVMRTARTGTISSRITHTPRTAGRPAVTPRTTAPDTPQPAVAAADRTSGRRRLRRAERAPVGGRTCQATTRHTADKRSVTAVACYQL
jgi:hypothetical protein